MIAVSACLCGDNCKYSGGNNYREEIHKLFEEGKAIKICPECSGGLPIPREPSEIEFGGGKAVVEGRSRVISQSGADVTAEYLKGAYETLKILKEHNIKIAILKSKSPSCGVGKIYDGTFSGTLTDGNGVTAQLLMDNGIEVRQI